MIPHLVFSQLVIWGLLWLCVMLPGPACALLKRPNQPRPSHRLVSAPQSLNPLQVSPTSHPVSPVNSRLCLPHCPLWYHRTRCPCPTGTHVRLIPPSTSVPIPGVTIAAGGDWAICAPTGIPTVARGGNGPVRPAAAPCLKATGRTIWHGKRVSMDLIVRVISCLAEGLGLRGTARGFEMNPHTVLQWVVEAAEQLRAFS